MEHVAEAAVLGLPWELVFVRREGECVHEARCRARRGRSIKSLVRVSATCTFALMLAGCSFDEAPLTGGGVRPPGSIRGGVTEVPSGPPPRAPVGGQDASMSGGDPPFGGESGAGSDASIDAPETGAGTAGASGGTGGGGGTGGDAESDAGTDASAPDTGAPACPHALPACVCAHTRLETPADPCAAPDCPLADCAPDEECELRRFESSVYYVCTDSRSQDEAVARCQRVAGMHLVFIESREEDDFLNGAIAGKVWIGATKDDGVWSWLDGTKFYEDGPIGGAYVNWERGVVAEPNGVGVGPGEVTCAILWSETNAWADTNCPAMNGYVCEVEL